MNNFNFTKSFIPKTTQDNSNSDIMNYNNEVKRLERINDNMNGINPYTKESLMRKSEKTNLENQSDDKEEDTIRKSIEALNSIKKN